MRTQGTTMPIDLPHLFVFLSGLAMASYGLIRFRIYLREPENLVAYHLIMGMILIGIGIGTFALFAAIAPHFAHEKYITALTAGLENLGYVHFIVIPAYVLLTKRRYIVIKYSLVVIVIVLTMLGVLFRPAEGAMFSDLRPLIGLGSSIFEELAVFGNVILLLINYQKLKRLSFLNTAGLIIFYAGAASSGAYFYLGNNPLLLNLAGVGLLMGVGLLLTSAIVELRVRRSEKSGEFPSPWKIA